MASRLFNRVHSLEWSGLGPVIQNHSTHGVSNLKDPMNSRPIHPLLPLTTIRVILDHWSRYESHQRMEMFPYYTPCVFLTKNVEVKFTSLCYLFINWIIGFERYAQLRKMTIFGYWRFVAWKEETFKLFSFNECVCGVPILQANRQCRH